MEYSSEQLKILNDPSSFQQIIASAGSGKTATMIALLDKIQKEGMEKQEEILVITFSRKAVREIQERLEKKSPEHKIKIKTFHAYCLYALKKYHPEFIDKDTSIISEIEKNNFYREYFRAKKYIVGGIPFELLISGRKTLQNYFPEVYESLDDEYNNYKYNNKKLDFDDLVKTYLTGLKENHNWAEMARSEVKRIIVDEFQDTDFEQLEWLLSMRPERLTVVGDDWQAIYGFRGATTAPFLQFGDYFKPCVKHFLTTNYRSLSEIVNISAIPIEKNKNNIPKKVKSHRRGKGFVKRLVIENKNDLLKLTESLSKASKPYCILARSNFRLSEYKNLRIPEENLLTIHGSKGLEFETVFLDLSRGWNISKNPDEETLQEERRILYVGLSRAKDNLIIIGNENTKEDILENEFFSYFKYKVSKMSTEEILKKVIF